MVKKKWCDFHKRMEPLDNFHLNSSSPDGYVNCCKKIQIKRTLISQAKKFPYKNEYNRLRMSFKRGIISEKTFLVEKETLKQRYNVK